MLYLKVYIETGNQEAFHLFLGDDFDIGTAAVPDLPLTKLLPRPEYIETSFLLMAIDWLSLYWDPIMVEWADILERSVKHSSG